MFSNRMVIEAELKAQSLREQADHERQARQAQMRSPRSIFETTARVWTAFQAALTACRQSFQTTRRNAI